MHTLTDAAYGQFAGSILGRRSDAPMPMAAIFGGHFGSGLLLRR